MARAFLTAMRRGGGRRLRGTLDFASIDDHARLPWRFLARRMTLDALRPGL